MDITVKYITGGFLGSDPLNPQTFDHIEFHSDSLNHTWRRKLKNGALKGTIRSQKKPLFDFIYTKESCLINFFAEEGSRSGWVQIEVMVCMCD